MKKFTRILIAMLALFVLAVPFAVVGAQGRTVTRTEAQVNSNYRVTNPALRSVSNTFVDLQAGQVTISATLTFRRGQPISAAATYTPSVSNGRITWTAASVLVNGEPASQSVVDQINASLQASWLNYVRGVIGTGRVSSVSITDADITVAFTGR
jgi:hypothetical protein